MTANDGTVASGTPVGKLYAYAIPSTTGPLAPITLNFTDSTGAAVSLNATPKQVLNLNWTVANAFSGTMQQCYAFTINTTDKLWSGKQTSTARTGFGGSVALTMPADPGTYTYSLTCGGVESGLVSISVNAGLRILTTSLPDGGVSAPYTTGIQVTGGVPPYSFGFGSQAPPGLSIGATDGLLTGTPLQFGVYQVVIGVQDSSKPAGSAFVSLPLTIASTLMLNDNLPPAKVGTAYTATIAATGGLPPYTYKLVSGTLPTGVAFNQSTGVVYGTPTQPGRSTFVVSATDAETTAAKVTTTFILDATPSAAVRRQRGVPPLHGQYFLHRHGDRDRRREALHVRHYQRRKPAWRAVAQCGDGCRLRDTKPVQSSTWRNHFCDCQRR